MNVNELIKEIAQMEPIADLEDEDYGMDPAFDVIQNIIDRLPNVWKDDLDWTTVEIATNGEEILLKYYLDCENLADALDNHVFGYAACHTGYYNPYEDARSGETDANSGWHYIDFE